MSTHTADDFCTARFATHPNGRIAARIDPDNRFPWGISATEDWDWNWRTDAQMVADGWSPLDETRPEVIQHEFTITGRMDPDDVARAIQRQIDMRSALSAAPATDEPEDDWQGLFNIESRRKTEAIARAEKAEEFAARWKETARFLLRDRKTAEHTGDLAIERAEKAEQDARTYALEQIEAAQAETTEAVTRAEKAERERDEMRESLFLNTRHLTAREHLDAAIALMDAKS